MYGDFGVFEERDLFDGLFHYRRCSFTPARPGVVTFHAIGMDAGKVMISVTPPPKTLWPMKTSSALYRYGALLAINGDGFVYQKQGGGYRVRLMGAAAAEGRQYDRRQCLLQEQTLYIDPDNNFSLQKPKHIWNAISFPNLLVNSGGGVGGDKPTITPRTVLGHGSAGQILVMVVDGSEGQAQGMTLGEAAAMMLRLEPSLTLAINLDGGGSSTLALRGADGRPQLLNVPSDDDLPGHERPVANHLLFTSKE